MLVAELFFTFFVFLVTWEEVKQKAAVVLMIIGALVVAYVILWVLYKVKQGVNVFFGAR